MAVVSRGSCCGCVGDGADARGETLSKAVSLGDPVGVACTGDGAADSVVAEATVLVVGAWVDETACLGERSFFCLRDKAFA